MRKKHPIRRRKEHPPLYIVQSLFFPLQLEPQQSSQQSQSDRLHPVELRQHPGPRFLEIPLREHFELRPETRRPGEIAVGVTGF